MNRKDRHLDFYRLNANDAAQKEAYNAHFTVAKHGLCFILHTFYLPFSYFSSSAQIILLDVRSFLVFCMRPHVAS